MVLFSEFSLCKGTGGISSVKKLFNINKIINLYYLIKAKLQKFLGFYDRKGLISDSIPLL